MTLFIQRKIRYLPATFTVDYFLDFLYFPVRWIVEFGTEDRTDLLRRLRLFLNLVTATCVTLGVLFVAKERKNFQVAIRKTQTLVEPIKDVERGVKQKLEELHKQRKLMEWFFPIKKREVSYFAPEPVMRAPVPHPMVYRLIFLLVRF